ncbi:MAG: DUF2723 domain-containing protein [Gemmatimonadaceae bacterium]
MTERRAWLPAALVLTVAYLTTLAPSVTFWDAGEFIAAARTLGIPHPPGTPLFILLLHTWGLPWADGLYATGLNLFSAIATASAAAISAVLVFRWLVAKTDPRFAFGAATAAAICAGAMYTAWSNATETEVYASSLALAMVMLLAAERGKGLLVAYCFGLAAALHVSALVAAPAAILLAVSRSDDRIDVASALGLGAAALAAMAIGTWNPVLAALAAIVSVVAICHPAPVEGLRMTGAVILGASPLLFMLVRAGFDPGINQGNPQTVDALIDVIGRRQYDLAPLWPRRAPLWIQFANWFEYADWQTALSLGPGVMPTVARTLTSVLFGVLALTGAVQHRRIDRRGWRAVLALLVAGTVGVAGYLNLRAGPSFGWGILPAGAIHEARERDYFFILGFWAVGLWAGIGAVDLARRCRLPIIAGVALASLPLVLNWSAVNRRSKPDASLPIQLARGLVATLPPRTVLFVAGDNDTYPVWYAREVTGLRRDVVLVTVPLIGADWYVGELIRRNPDLALASTSEGANARTIADAARGAGRPVAASITLEKRDRIQLNGCWVVIGLAILDRPGGSNCSYESRQDTAPVFPVDQPEVQRWIESFVPRPIPSVKSSIDPAAEHFARILNCPRLMLETARRTGGPVSLDSLCNP